MINITSLQSHLLENNFTSNPVISYSAIFGSGMSTVFKDLSSQVTDLTLVVNDFKAIGQINEEVVLRHISINIINTFNQKGLMKLKVEDVKGADFYALSQFIKAIARTYNKHSNVVLVFSDFDILVERLNPYFFELMKEIIEIENDNGDRMFKFVLAQEKYIDNSDILNKLGSLVEYYSKSREYLQGFTIDEISEVLQPITADYLDVSKMIMSLTAGNPKIVDRLLDIIAHMVDTNKKFDINLIDVNEIIKDVSIEYTVFNIWKGFTQKQKNILLSLEEDSNIEVEYLKNCGLIVVNEQGKASSNFVILKSYLSYKTHNKTLSHKDPQVNKVERKKYDTDSLSTQEFMVFDLFQKNANKLITKQQISKIMGGSKRDGKRKDWAIDQLMKRLRGKIGDSNAEVLQTIRGRGYKFVG